MRRRQRGSTMVESAIVATVFLTLLCGIMQFGFIGFAYNNVCFSAHRAARYASLHGASSGFTAAASDVKANALSYIAGLDTAALTITTTWSPDNSPGSMVQVNVAYSFKPFLVNVSSTAFKLQCTTRQTIIE